MNTTATPKLHSVELANIFFAEDRSGTFLVQGTTTIQIESRIKAGAPGPEITIQASVPIARGSSIQDAERALLSRAAELLRAAAADPDALVDLQEQTRKQRAQFRG